MKRRRIKDVIIKMDEWERDGKLYVPRSLTGIDQKWPLNPPQTEVLKIINERCNLVLSAKTSAGKTACIVMLSYGVLRSGHKICYVAPYKALTMQKYNEWTKKGSPFYKYNVAIINSDFQWTKEQIRKVQEADIICSTPESILAALRNYRNKKNKWPLDISKLFIDEAHLICEEGRGANLEAMVAGLSDVSPECEIVMLSGTIPNAEDFTDWLTQLNGKETKLIASDFRPVPLKIKYEYYNTSRMYNIEEDQRVDIILNIAKATKKDQNMYGIFNKKFGYALEEKMKDAGIRCAFHNADITDPKKRRAIEDLIDKGVLKDVLGTATIMTGMDYAIYRVVVTQVHHGQNDIPAYQIQQLMGRAGRFPYHTEGEAIILLPEDDADYHKQRIEKGEPIMSELLAKEQMLTHLLGAIYSNDITDTVTMLRWMRRTLAYQQFLQTRTDEDIVQMMMRYIGLLVEWRLIVENEEGKDYYEVTARGKICAQMLLAPEHFATLIKNLRTYFHFASKSDYDLAYAVSAVPPYAIDHDTRMHGQCDGIVETRCPLMYRRAVQATLDRIRNEPTLELCKSMSWRVFEDAKRYGGAMMRVAEETKGFQNHVDAEEIYIAFARVRTGTSVAQATMEYSRFRPSEIRALTALGLYTKADVSRNPKLAATVLTPKRMGELGIRGRVHK